MSINTTTRKAGPFAGNGSQTVFPFAFKIFSAADILAVRAQSGVETTLALATDYTVAMNPDQDNSPGGSVTLLSALAVGQSLVLTTNVSALQQVTMTNAGGFFPAVFNAVFDKLTVLIQQVLEKIGRQLTVAITSGVSDLTVPVQASGILQWNALGTGLQALDPNSLGLSVALPSQTGNSGKALFTNGVTPSWSNVLPSDTGKAGQVLLAGGSGTPAWSPSVNIGYRLLNGSGTVAASDKGALLDFQGTFTPTWPSAASLGAGWWCYARNSGSGVITGPTVDGSVLSITAGDQYVITSDGSVFRRLDVRRAEITFRKIQSDIVPTNGATTQDVTWVGGTYNEIRLVLRGVTISAVQALLGGVTNDGTNWSASANLMTGGAYSTYSGIVSFQGLLQDYGNAETSLVDGAVSLTSARGIAPANIGNSGKCAWRADGGLRGVRLTPNSGATFLGGGTIEVWGR